MTENMRGMTVNERLFSLDKFEAFEKAIKSKSTQQAINILIDCALPRNEAENIVETIFQAPEAYGY